MIESATDVIVARARDHEGWIPVLVMSIAVHAAVVGAAVFMPSLHVASDAPKTVMTISLGGAPGPRAGGMTPMGGQPVQQVAPAAKPQAATQPAQKAPAMTLPARNARVRELARVRVSAREASGRVPTTGDEVQEGSTRADTGARGQGFGLTGGGGTGAGAYLDVGDFCCPEYLETVVQTIQRNWLSKQSLTGQVLMKFTIGRNGALTDVQVERPSGFVELDLAAQRALVSTQRVPPLPAPFPNPNLTVHLRFEYQR